MPRVDFNTNGGKTVGKIIIISNIHTNTYTHINSVFINITIGVFTEIFIFSAFLFVHFEEGKVKAFSQALQSFEQREKNNSLNVNADKNMLLVNVHKICVCLCEGSTKTSFYIHAILINLIQGTHDINFGYRIMKKKRRGKI
jgi:hypothetical protein